MFGEANFDVSPQFTMTAGGRWYKFDNTLFGFAGSVAIPPSPGC